VKLNSWMYHKWFCDIQQKPSGLKLRNATLCARIAISFVRIIVEDLGAGLSEMALPILPCHCLRIPRDDILRIWRSPLARAPLNATGRPITITNCAEMNGATRINIYQLLDIGGLNGAIRMACLMQQYPPLGGAGEWARASTARWDIYKGRVISSPFIP